MGGNWRCRQNKEDENPAPGEPGFLMFGEDQGFTTMSPT